MEVLLAGLLSQKEGGVSGFHTWGKYFCVMTSSEIKFFGKKDQAQKKLLRAIEIRSIVKCKHLPAKRTGGRFDITVERPQEQELLVQLDAESTEHATKWVHTITEAKSNINQTVVVPSITVTVAVSAEGEGDPLSNLERKHQMSVSVRASSADEGAKGGGGVGKPSPSPSASPRNSQDYGHRGGGAGAGLASPSARLPTSRSHDNFQHSHELQDGEVDVSVINWEQKVAMSNNSPRPSTSSNTNPQTLAPTQIHRDTHLQSQTNRPPRSPSHDEFSSRGHRNSSQVAQLAPPPQALSSPTHHQQQQQQRLHSASQPPLVQQNNELQHHHQQQQHVRKFSSGLESGGGGGGGGGGEGSHTSAAEKAHLLALQLTQDEDDS